MPIPAPVDAEVVEVETRSLVLTLTLAAALPVLAALPPEASAGQDPAVPVVPASPPAADVPRCTADGCEQAGELLFRVRSRGELDATAERSEADRSVGVTHDPPAAPAPEEPGVARISGQFRVDLPSGGMVWATEDPAQGTPIMNVRTGATAPLRDGRFTEPLRLHAYANHAAFIERLEVAVYRGSDTDLVRPLATIQMPVGNLVRHEWDGESLADAAPLRAGDTLLYVARAYDAAGSFDETVPQQIHLITPEEHERGSRRLRDEVSRVLGQQVEGETAQRLQIEDSIYGRSALRVQNIPVHGSRVRIHGRDIPRGARLRIDGQDIPVDQEGKFAAEFLEPVGRHVYALELQAGDTAVRDTLEVDVTGRYQFMVALADLTLSSSNISGSIEPLAGDEGFGDGFLAEGRLAFYLKGKIRGRYLLTAQADTRERELKDLFDGFFDAEPTDLFRTLDPDAYYPVYGDDSTTWRDVDSQGRFYLRLDWDGNQALWGNFNTGITGSEFAQYQRGLYGAALDWRSRRHTGLGEPGTQVRAFASEAQTVLGHSQFLGTGGSLYYLRHTNLLPGSDQVVLEVRDHATGRVEATTRLQRGADYEIDALQGRIFLTRPLAQLTRENVRTLTRDTPLDGYEQLLLVDYEYLPTGFRGDDITAGLRGRHWFGDHVGVGVTAVDENRRGDDYTLLGADLTLQAGRGTYLKLEQVRTEATVAPVFYSDNGGLDFIQRNPVDGAREGDARSVEARANFRELGWTRRDWSAGAWWRDVDAGFSIARSDTGLAREEYGAEFLGWFSEGFSLFGRHTRAEQGGQALEQSQLNAEWRPREHFTLAAELSHLSQERSIGDAEATLAALRYTQRVGSSLELSATGQLTLDDDEGRYANNDLLTLGARYLFGERSSVGAEVSSGSRGHGGRVDAEYHMGADRTLYGAYNYSTDSTARDSLFNPAVRNGWTLGQRSRITDRTRVFSESQYLKETARDESGLAHTFGLDFLPGPGWNLGFTVMDAELDAARGRVDRRAYSISGGRTDPRTQWSSKLEYRKDSGAEQREQWVTTNRLLHRLNEDWRIAVRANHSRTDDRLSAYDGAELSEVNLGFAWRPHDSTRWAAFGKYTYLYDLASAGQIGGAINDQRSHVLALEAIHQLDDRWQVAGKLASRWGDYRMGRGVGEWLDSRATLGALQLRYRLRYEWDALAEFRRLDVADGGTRDGWLVGVDRRIGDNFKVGLGYNFTSFSDDLTDLEYDHRGWFLNLAGYY